MRARLRIPDGARVEQARRRAVTSTGRSTSAGYLRPLLAGTRAVSPALPMGGGGVAAAMVVVRAALVEVFLGGFRGLGHASIQSVTL